MSDPLYASTDLNIKDMHTFISVATTGSFRASATLLYSSQPAVSRSIARLEKDLGVQLLLRGARGAVVTDAGRRVLEQGNRLIGDIQKLRDELHSGWTNVVRLGVAATAAGSYLAPFLSQWIPSHPDVRVEVIEHGAAVLSQMLEQRDCDIAIIESPTEVRLFELHPLTDIRIRAHFPPEHELSRFSEMIHLRDLARHKLLINDQTFISARLLLKSFLSAAIQPQIIYRSASGHTLAALAHAGMGVAVFGDSVAVGESALISRPITADGLVPLGFDLGVAWHRQGTPDYVRSFGMELSAFSQAI